MKTVAIVGLLLLTITATDAFAMSTASAETTLLVRWLVGGNEFTGSLATETKGSVLIEGLEFKIGIVCEGIIDGYVFGSNGEDLATTVLTKAGGTVGEKLSGTALECTGFSGCESSITPLVWSLNLPWTTLLYLTESGTFADHIFGEAGFEVECAILLSRVSEECKFTASTGTNDVLLNVTAGVEATEEALLPTVNCTTGGTGGPVLVPLAGNLTSVAEGVLSVSSE
jgi:hypothetical protein